MVDTSLHADIHEADQKSNSQNLQITKKCEKVSTPKMTEETKPKPQLWRSQIA